jgi:hypothetical protein
LMYDLPSTKESKTTIRTNQETQERVAGMVAGSSPA